MKEECGSFMAALSVKVVTVNMLLSVFFLPGVLAACGEKQAGLFITAPKKMEALSGSCLLIPCILRARSGHTFDNKGTIYGVWMKNNLSFSTNPNIVIFNSSKPDNVYNMKIIGNLSQKNCTTQFYNLNSSQSYTYFFRIENGKFRATACNDSLQITVKDSPQSPRIEISGDVKDLKEKESVTITCSAFTPCPHSPPELTWNLQQDSHRHTEENTDGTFTTKIQQDITLSDTHDGYTITCSASYPVIGGKHVKTSETEETLSVSYAPKNTSASISTSGLVSAGSWVNLSCSSRAKPPVSSFTWFRNSSEGDVKVAEGEFYSFNATDGGVYYCVAANDLGNQTSQTVHLNMEGSSDGYTSAPWEAFLGGIIGILLLVVCVCGATCWWKKKAANSNGQQLQSQTSEEFDLRMPGNKTEEKLRYEDVNFIQRPEASSVSVQDSRQQQETAYAQVNVSPPENSSTQTANGPEDLYAQVKKEYFG